MIKTCHICNNEFETPKPRQEYCSKPCSNRARTGFRDVEKKCCICKNIFIIRRCENKKKTCSRKCLKILMQRLFNSPESKKIRSENGKRNLGKKHPETTKSPVIKTCIQCESRYTISRGKASTQREKSRFCSKECWYNYIRDDEKRHPSYRGGHFPYYGPDWKMQARKARERDNNTCQRCGKKQFKPKLHVHHITPRRKFKSMRRANRLYNLTTLCNSCHRRVEP